MPSTSHAEFVRDVVKRYGITAFCKSMVSNQKAYNVSEADLTDLIATEAQAEFPDLSKSAAFSKLYTEQSERGLTLRKSVAIAKSATFAGTALSDVVTMVPGGAGGTFQIVADGHDPYDEAEAIKELKRLGREKWPSATALEQFERALLDPANRELQQKAHRRPTPPAGGIYAFPG